MSPCEDLGIPAPDSRTWEAYSCRPMRLAIHTAVILRGEVSGVMNHSVCQRCAGRDGAKPAYLGLPREGPGKRLVHQGRPVRSCSYSIFELSVNTISGAPSFVRSLRKGWETTDILRNCKHTDRKSTRLNSSHLGI